MCKRLWWLTCSQIGGAKVSPFLGVGFVAGPCASQGPHLLPLGFPLSSLCDCELQNPFVYSDPRVPLQALQGWHYWVYLFKYPLCVKGNNNNKPADLHWAPSPGKALYWGRAENGSETGCAPDWLSLMLFVNLDMSNALHKLWMKAVLPS